MTRQAEVSPSNIFPQGQDEHTDANGAMASKLELFEPTRPLKQSGSFPVSGMSRLERKRWLMRCNVFIHHTTTISDVIADILPHLSQPRIATYLRVCNQDESRAVELYRANAMVSGSAFTALHYFEVILRNSMDRELRTWNAKVLGPENWTQDAAPLLLAIIGSKRLKEAGDDAQRAIGKKREPTHDDVLAQCSLGTWRYLLPSQKHQGKQQLWDEAIEHAFPNRHDVRADQIAESVSIAYDFRNRVAHHEPVFKLDLRGKRRAMRDVLNSIGSDARRWFVEHDPLQTELNHFYKEWPQFERKN